MNPYLQQLYHIAQKKERLIIGLMSGTSLDGLDVALCKIGGSGLQTQLSLIDFETVPYSDDFKRAIRSVFSKKNIELEKLTLLHSGIARQHAEMVLACLQKWQVDKSTIDLIASHGQTVYHAPKSLHQKHGYGNATLQIGDGDHLAVATGIITISDFRQKHIAAGGEGAPLAVYGDYILCSKKNQDRILINIGGIANFTYLPGSLKTEEIVCTDTGPGNILMDMYVQQNIPGKYFDENASLASKGKINNNLLGALKQHPFFLAPFPKTTGPELFNLQYLDEAKKIADAIDLNVEDTMATLNKFTTETLAEAIKKCLGNTDLKIYISGGGAHNPVLTNHLNEEFSHCTFASTESLGINPDAKEAILFALLANECVCGSPQHITDSTNAIPAISMGKISFPG